MKVIWKGRCDIEFEGLTRTCFRNGFFWNGHQAKHTYSDRSYGRQRDIVEKLYGQVRQPHDLEVLM